ncbi:MAG: thioredoxin family protein [Verrucomicrobia bacterium]|nr:thioredoxin family protein [Verrucomicrobiota bacterium]
MARRLLFLCLVLSALRCAAEPPAGWSALEEEVAAAVRGPQVTVVHFWAPWCPNSRAELANHGWSTFLALNRDVKFIFVTVRSSDDCRALLHENGVGDQPNLVLRHHPNQVRRGDGVIQSFMALPLTWVPSTWVFCDGRLRYALNYGEVRFPLLQQLIRDAADPWEHPAPVRPAAK